MSQISKLSTGGGGGGIETINGDVGSITGPVVTIFANNATNNSGSTVLFENSGTVSTLNVSDVDGNTIVGNGSGNLTSNGVSNTSLGYFNMQFLTIGSYNTIIGFNSLGVATTASGNTSLGYGCLGLLDSGSNNIAIGFQGVLNKITTGGNNIAIGEGSGESYLSSESNNILIQNDGVVGESNVLRIGTQGSLDAEVNKCFVAGITGSTAAGAPVAVSSTGQLSDLGFGTATQVLTSNGAGVSPTWQAAGGGGAATGFYAFCSTDKVNVTGTGVSYTVIFDSTQRNDGGAFNTGTGVFTAPTTGLYSFVSNIILEGINATTTSLLIYVSGSAFSQFIYSQGFGSVNGSGTYASSSSFIIPMTSGDTIHMVAYSDQSTKTVTVGGGAFGANTSSSFAGYRIGT